MTSSEQTTPRVLIIGASRGIGLELTRQYAALGVDVHATTRTLHSPGELGAIADSMNGTVTLHALDVCDQGTINALINDLQPRAIDVLIHNAGIKDSGHSQDLVMQVNAHAPIALCEALLGARTLRAGARIVLMSSQMGARHGRRGSLGLYGDSKAALNDAFRERAPHWAEHDVTAIVMHPGWVKTDMGGPGAPVSVTDSAQGIRTVVDAMSPQDHGRFLTWRGDEHPW